jgi:hypothetical protein
MCKIIDSREFRLPVVVKKKGLPFSKIKIKLYPAIGNNFRSKPYEPNPSHDPICVG